MPLSAESFTGSHWLIKPNAVSWAWYFLLDSVLCLHCPLLSLYSFIYAVCSSQTNLATSEGCLVLPHLWLLCFINLSHCMDSFSSFMHISWGQVPFPVSSVKPCITVHPCLNLQFWREHTRRKQTLEDLALLKTDCDLRQVHLIRPPSPLLGDKNIGE